jgi:hypothetical protein
MPNYIYSGNVAAQQLYKGNERPKYILDAVLRGVLNNPKPSISVRYPVSNTTKNIQKAFASNYSKKVDKYYKYGLNRHLDSLPSNRDLSYNQEYSEPNNDIPAEINGILSDIEGEPCTATSYFYGRPDPAILFGIEVGLDPAFTGTYYRVKYLDKWWEQTEIRHVGTDLIVQLKEVVWYEAPDERHEPSQWIPAVPLNEQEIIFDLSLTSNLLNTDIIHQVRYYLDSTRELKFWTYNESDNLYPELHGQSTYIEQGSFPFAMLIEEGTHVISGELGEPYKASTEKMLRTIDMNLETLMEALDDPDDPDALRDVQDAFLLYSVNLDTEDQYSLQYLYEWMRYNYHAAPSLLDLGHQDWIDTHIADEATIRFSYLPVVTFANNRTSFKVYQRWTRIQVKNGNVDDVHPAITVAELEIAHPTVSEIDAGNNGTFGPVETFAGSGIFVDVGKVTKTVQLGVEYGMSEIMVHSVNSHLLILRKQLNLTQFVEIIVMGLSHYTILNSPSDNPRHSGQRATVVRSLEDISSGGFFIPLSRLTMDAFNSIDQSYIAFAGLTVVVQLVTITKIPWYADANLWNAIGIFLTVVSLGSASSFVEAVKQLIIAYALGLIVTEIVFLLVDLIGGEAAMILAVIAGVLARDSSIVKNLLFDLVSAEQIMLMVSNSLMTAANAQVADGFLKLEQEKAEYENLKESRKEELESIEDMIVTGSTLDIYDLLKRVPDINTTETPTSFFNRSIHLTNPGVLSLDNIDFYVEGLLELPMTNPLDEMNPIVV